MAVTTRDRKYRIVVHKRGETFVSDSTIDFTIEAELKSIPSVGAQSVDILSGSTVTAPWTVSVTDKNEVVTSNLSNSGGEAHLLGRVVQIQMDEGNTGTWTTLQTGRLSNITLNNEVASYDLEISDEHWKVRNTTAFEGLNSTVLYPPSQKESWRKFNKWLNLFAGVAEIEQQGNFKRLQVFSDFGTPPNVTRWIRNDLKDDPEKKRSDGVGNFKNLKLRFKDDSVPIDQDFEIITFDGIDDGTFVTSTREWNSEGFSIFRLWVWDPNDDIDTDVIIDSTSFDPTVNGVQLHAPTASPSETVPLHIHLLETTDPATPLSVPNTTWELVTKLYDIHGIRYNQQVFDDLESAGIYPDVTFRITETESLDRFLSEKIYAPLLVIPFVNDDGEIAPRPVRLPNTDSNDNNSIDPNTLFTFDKNNVIEHPTWDHNSREIVNKIIFKSVFHGWLVISENFSMIDVRIVDTDSVGDVAGDRLLPFDREGEIDYKTQEFVGIKEKEYDLSGFRIPGEGNQSIGPPVSKGTVDSAASLLQHDVFERWGNGPIRGRLRGQYSTDTVKRGDWVKINLSSFPTLQSGGSRGNTRIVQILEKIKHPDHIEFEYLDAGPDLQPLPTPTVSIVQNSSDPHNVVDITVSGVSASIEDAAATLRIGFGSTEPTAWNRTITGVENETISVTKVPSGTKVWVQAQQTAPNRIRSGWTASDSITTQALSPLTNLSTTISGGKVLITFTVGESNFPIMPVIAETPDTLVDFKNDPISTGSTRFVFDGLKLSTEYELGVKHVDAFGGESSATTVTVTTDATGNTLSEPRKVHFRQANSDDLPEFNYDSRRVIGEGFQIEWNPTERQAKTVIEWSTSSSFSTIEGSKEAGSGVSSTFITEGISLDGVERFIRLRHERRGYTNSSWSTTISAKPTVLVRNPGPDLFSSGWARLSVDPDGKLRRHIGSSDGDTDRAYYEVSVNPTTTGEFPTVDFTDSFDARADFPVSEIVQDGGGSDITLTVGDEALITVRFWSEITGFGQESRDRLVIDQSMVAPLTGKLKATESPDASSVDLTAEVFGASGWFPVTVEIFEDDPDSVAIASTTLSSEGTFDFNDDVALNDIPLPRKQTKSWFMRLTDTFGNESWSGFTSADRNRVPNGSVESIFSGSTPEMTVFFDTDTSEVVITTPSGDKTFSGLSGGGSVAYEVGVTALDDASTETEMSAGEIRSYDVTLKGNGFTEKLETVKMHYPQIFADQNPVGVSGWSFSGSFSATDADTVSWTSGTLTLANGDSFSIAASSTGNMTQTTYIYFDESNNSTFQVTQSANTAIGSGKLLIAVAENNSDTSKNAIFNSFGTQDIGPLVVADNIAADTITGNEIFGNSLSVIFADMGTLTAGKILAGNIEINADTERILFGSASEPLTGIGIFLGKDGTDYEFRVGDPADQFLHWDGSALTFDGKLDITHTGSTHTITGNTQFKSELEVLGTLRPKGGMVVEGGASELHDSILEFYDSGNVFRGDIRAQATGTAIFIRGNIEFQDTIQWGAGAAIASSDDVVETSDSINVLSDVDTTTVAPSPGEHLEWDGSNWVPGAAGGGASSLNDLSDVSLGTPVSGEVLQYNGTNWVDSTVAFSELSGSIANSQVPQSAVTQHEGAIDHGSIAGLGGDDHTQYVHTTTARTVSAGHTYTGTPTFNPSATGSPFSIGANGSGQLVGGLNADQLDGNEASAFALSSHTHALDDLSDVDITTPGSGEVLKFTTSWVNATLDHSELSGVIGDEHIDHSTVSISAGTGLSGGGDITLSRTINLSHLGIESLADPNADRILFWDDSAGATGWLTPGTGIAISTTSLQLDAVLNDLNDVGASPADGEVLKWTDASGGSWVAAVDEVSASQDLTELNDVTISSPADNEVLAFDGTSTWINQTPAEANLIAVGTSAGGDLSGTYPNPDVVKIQGTDLDTGLNAANDGDVLTWSGTNLQWEAKASGA